MTISYLKLKKVAFFCLALPSVIFVLGFLKWYIGIPVALLLGLAYFFSVRDMKSEEDRTVTLSIPSLLLLFGVVVLWCYLAGLGNLYSQSDDWAARNAIFRDLIRFEWPVVYGTKNAALVYYIGFWLPAALLGKGTFLLTGRLPIAWTVGNMALWAWSAICVFIIFLLVFVYMKVSNRKQMWWIVLIFIFFGGVDILGTLYNTIFRHWAFPIHLEWWTSYQFSSMTTALNWVFNQSIFAWMATILFLLEKRVRNYAFIIVFVLSSSPMPAVGLGLYMVGYAVYLLWHAAKAKQVGAFFRDVFTVQNVIAAVTLVPIYFLYYKTNLAVNVGQAYTVTPPRDWGGIVFLFVLAAALVAAMLMLRRRKPDLSVKLWLTAIVTLAIIVAVMLLDPSTRLQYFFFLLMEAFVFLLLIWSDFKEDPLFYLTWGIAMLCPLITVGTAADFCMRASIPMVFVLMMLCMRYLFGHASLLKEKTSLRKVLYIALIVVMVLGAITAVIEFYRGAREFILGKRAFDWIYTMDQIFTGPSEGTDRNFIANSYREHFFFRYLSK